MARSRVAHQRHALVVAGGRKWLREMQKLPVLDEFPLGRPMMHP